MQVAHLGEVEGPAGRVAALDQEVGDGSEGGTARPIRQRVRCPVLGFRIASGISSAIGHHSSSGPTPPSRNIFDGIRQPRQRCTTSAARRVNIRQLREAPGR
jgi:hypothetical protein